MDGIAWASSAMSAAQNRLDIATENLANVSSDGYRRRSARGFLTAQGARIEAQISSEHGALRRTGRTYDLAIAGDGGFRLRDGRGRVTTTRNGALSRSADGCLRDAAGRTLIDVRGHAIHVADAEIPSAAQLGLPEGASLQSGALETSDVDAISEMVDVLTAQRAYEGAQKTASAIDETRRQSADAARIT
jgi:flagellar basal body rod protein FlgG